MALSTLALQHIEVQTGLLDDPKYHNIYSVEVVNRLVQQGVAFRDAYRQVAQQIAEGQLALPQQLTHVHEGSLGNLCLPDISRKFEAMTQAFDFGYRKAIESLLTR